MQPLSVRFAATSITWALAKPNGMRRQNSIKLGFVFKTQLTKYPCSCSQMLSTWIRLGVLGYISAFGAHCPVISLMPSASYNVIN